MPRGFLSPYPWQRVPRLAMRVRYRQAEAAHHELDVLLEEIAQEHDKALDLCRLRCGMVMSYCLRGARLGGAPSDAIMQRMIAAMDTLARKRSWPAVRKLMHAFIDDLMEHVTPRGHSPLVRLIARMQHDLLNRPEWAQPLKSYAAAAKIHPDRLSRVFHQITGQTFNAMRRQGRVACAQHRLTASRATVTQIARSLGMADTSRFIREFKSEIGQTPGQFRGEIGITRRDAETLPKQKDKKGKKRWG